MNNTLLDLFATFVGEDINVCIHWEPKLSDDYSDHNVLDAHDRKLKLKMASIILLKSIDNVDFTDDSGQTFLHHFIEIFLNDFSRLTADRRTVGLNILENLLDKGASLHITCNEGFSPIQIVLDNRQTEIVQLVLTKLNKICLCYVKNCKDRQSTDTTPLHLDVGDYSVEVLQICLDSGIDFIIHADSNTTPLMIVCKFVFYLSDVSIKIRVVDALINRGCDVNAVDSNGYSAFHYAIQKQHPYLLQRLLTHGADVDQKTKDMRTPLCLALQIKNLYKIKMLLKAGANADAEVVDNIISLMLAKIKEHKSKIIQILEVDSDIKCQNEIWEFESLHVAALKYSSVLFDLILEKGSDVNARTKCGLTALHLASLTGNFKIVQKLIKRGADVNCQETRYCLTPLHLVPMSRKQFYELVDEHNRTNGVLTSAARFILQSFPDYDNKMRSSVIELLIKNGADVNVRDSRGMTPLHYAALQTPFDRSDVLPALLRSGAYVNLQADDGQLPLHNAMKQHNPTVSVNLIQFGTDLNDIDQGCLNAFWMSSTYYILTTYLSAQGQLDEFNHYMAKLKIAGFIDTDFTIFNEISENRQIYNDLYSKYSGEVNKLKSYFIEDGISLYDWLRFNHTKAKPFYLIGVPLQLKSQFPVYYEIIEARNRAVSERIPLLEPAKLAWYQITKIDLPEICVELILFHLNNKYLRLLADNLESEEFQMQS